MIQIACIEESKGLQGIVGLPEIRLISGGKKSGQTECSEREQEEWEEFSTGDV